MEMRIRYWVAATIGLCTLIAAVMLPPEGSPPRRSYAAERSVERSAERRVEDHLLKARRKLRVLEGRDATLARVAARDIDPAEPVFFVSEGFPERALEPYEASLRTVWSRMRAPDSDIRLVVAARGTRGRGDFPGVDFLLPHATDGSTCIIRVTASPNQLRLIESGVRPGNLLENWSLTHTGFENAITRGPCLFFASFGKPGPDIERWLDTWDFSFASLADWDGVQQLPYEPTIRGSPWIPLPASPEGFGGVVDSRMWDTHACASGREERCRANMLADPEKEATPARIWRFARSQITLPGYVRGSRDMYVYGIQTAHFLSDVVRDIGPERFELFWTSDLPVDQAFASVVGRGIGEWTSDWLAERVGRKEFGPGVGLNGMLVVALFAALGAFAGAYGAEKRIAG
jgi:hypothetical protein